MGTDLYFRLFVALYSNKTRRCGDYGGADCCTTATCQFSRRSHNDQSAFILDELHGKSSLDRVLLQEDGSSTWFVASLPGLPHLSEIKV